MSRTMKVTTRTHMHYKSRREGGMDGSPERMEAQWMDGALVKRKRLKDASTMKWNKGTSSSRSPWQQAERPLAEIIIASLS